MGGKRRKNTRTRPAIVTSRAVTPVDLLLLAGLPHPLHTRIGQFLKELAGAYSKVLAVPSRSHDGNLYRQNTIELLLRAAADFSIWRLTNRGEQQLPQPRRIALFYVPSDDDQQLIEAFDFFVSPHHYETSHFLTASVIKGGMIAMRVSRLLRRPSMFIRMN